MLSIFNYNDILYNFILNFQVFMNIIILNFLYKNDILYFNFLIRYDTFNYDHYSSKFFLLQTAQIDIYLSRFNSNFLNLSKNLIFSKMNKELGLGNWIHHTVILGTPIHYPYYSLYSQLWLYIHKLQKQKTCFSLY